MTDDELVEQLRGWWNTDHEADDRGFCKVCSLRMPCDWVQIVDECIEAADVIGRYETLADRIRQETGLDGDSYELIEQAVSER